MVCILILKLLIRLNKSISQGVWVMPDILTHRKNKKWIQNFCCNIRNQSTDLRRIFDQISEKQEMKVWAGFDWLNLRFDGSTHFAKLHFNIYYIILLHSVSSLHEKNCPSARCTPVVNLVYKGNNKLKKKKYFYFCLLNCLVRDKNPFCMADLLVTVWYCFILYFVPFAFVHFCMCSKILLIQDP